VVSWSSSGGGVASGRGACPPHRLDELVRILTLATLPAELGRGAKRVETSPVQRLTLQLTEVGNLHGGEHTTGGAKGHDLDLLADVTAAAKLRA
jgi:hypothetical protein